MPYNYYQLITKATYPYIDFQVLLSLHFVLIMETPGY